MIKLLFGILIGILIALSSYLSYHYGISSSKGSTYLTDSIVKKTLKDEIKKYNKRDTLNINDEFTQLKITNAVNDEKINTLNSRFNDLYVLGGIIITLLLIIMAGVYIRTEHEVGKHLKENYDTYKNQITEQLNDAKALVGDIKSEHKIAKDLSEQFKKTKKDDDGNRKP